MVEVIVSMLLLGVIAIAILPALWQGVVLSSQQSSTATATRHLNSLVEEVRETPDCASIAAAIATRTVTDGKGETLTSTGTQTTCAAKTTVTVQLQVQDASTDVLASTTAIVYIP
ncbi:hypothetical protein HF576_18925 [Microbacterium sp. CFH 90308]|uniref:Type II secretion system protein n=1 Tax=Microbacterium salsuginis TaxID=2722803 RepID=A0ABX1KG83_9MICO|nr:hypothetical protein [Microbacterium sp. CFH 90308]NLP85909.1 hypothetical protein [Microbacterium sp. CFH 90308]